LGESLALLLAWAGDGGATCVIHLLGGVVESSIRRAGRQARFWDENLTVPLSTMMASMDVSPFMKASLKHSCCCVDPSPTCWPDLLLVVLRLLCIKLLYALVCSTGLDDVAAVVASPWRMLCR
jgi:hypothetical protein